MREEHSMKDHRPRTRLWGWFLLFGLLALGVIVGCRSNKSQSVLPGGPAGESVLDKIKRTGSLSACYIKYPPFVIQDPQTGKLSGYFIDLMAAIAKEGNLAVDYEETNWGTMITALQSGKCDIIVSGVFPTILRTKEVTFTTPLLYVGLSGIARKNDNRFKTAADLTQKGLAIAVT